VSDALDRRRAYEASVRQLSALARALLADGNSEEVVARRLVAERNALKLRFRAADPPAIVALMEARNRAKYGHPIGPTADQLKIKYGGWSEVIAAASRPARLSG
jgi:hypothetical protein